MLYIGKVENRFLLDVDGPATEIQLNCLKPHVGSGTILESPPEHLPDIYMCKTFNAIAGPIRVIPTTKGNKKWDVLDYVEIKKTFDMSSGLDRESLWKEL